MDGEPLTIVGVMPSGFALHLPPDAGVPPYLEAWVPWGGGYEESPRSFRVLTAVGPSRGLRGLGPEPSSGASPAGADRAHPPRARGPLDDRGIRPLHRLRQRGEPVPGSRHEPHARGSGTAGGPGGPPPAFPPDRGRKGSSL